ncbi:MAG: hypothetical protein WBC70_14620 [Candidatus Aminicenantales bacterium]
MAKIPYDVGCPACGQRITGQRKPGQAKVDFVCPRCTAKFYFVFERPNLELAFMAGDLPPNLRPRERLVESAFPDAAIFSIFKKR